MAKYRKKPVVIEAVQFDGTDKSVDWLHPQLVKGEIGRTNSKLYIKTLEGTMEANISDYVIKGVNGEFYPCKPDAFEKTYELITDEIEGELTIKIEPNIHCIKLGDRVVVNNINGSGYEFLLHETGVIIDKIEESREYKVQFDDEYIDNYWMEETELMVI